jgi:lysozyme
MRTTKEVQDFIKEKESLKLKAYLCPAGKWTIGYGNTFYENNKKVRQGDVITKERAEKLFATILERFEKEVDKLLSVEVNDNKFSALVSFAYNVGVANLKSSTLLKKVNENPNDRSIAKEFSKWRFSNGKVLNGLVTRRAKEAEIFFK